MRLIHLYGTAINEKAEDSAVGIQKLGDMMRFMLDENHQDLIPDVQGDGILKKLYCFAETPDTNVA